MPLADLITELGALIGGVPGTVVRYAAAIIRAHELKNAAVRARIAQDRRTGMAAGQAAYEAAKVAGKRA